MPLVRRLAVPLCGLREVFRDAMALVVVLRKIILRDCIAARRRPPVQIERFAVIPRAEFILKRRESVGLEVLEETLLRQTLGAELAVVGLATFFRILDRLDKAEVVLRRRHRKNNGMR